MTNEDEEAALRLRLSEILSSVGDSTARLATFRALVEEFISSQNVKSLKLVVDIMLSDDSQYNLFSRPVLHEVAERMNRLNCENLKSLAEHIILKLRGRVVSFEVEDSLVREHLAECLIIEKDFGGAAKYLAAINLESGVRHRATADKTSKYVKIAELFLEDEDATSAESYCNRAGMIIHEVDDIPLTLRFKVTQARIADAKCKFYDAATRYYELSQNLHNQEIIKEDLMRLLENAVTCIILAPAGPQRSRLLATLVKDERISHTRNFEILKKMFMERIIRLWEISKFSESLQAHQKARLPDGRTVLERALLQHNVLAASKIYKNMRLRSLGELLDSSASKAELMAARMINEKRLDAYIDQRSGIIYFGSAESEQLEGWDHQIHALCTQINETAEAIEADEEFRSICEHWKSSPLI